MIKTLFLLLLACSLYAGEKSYAILLQYHRFDESKYPSTNISAIRFEKHLRYLKEHHFHVLPLSTIVESLQNGKQLPPKTVAITIDDAYKSVYTVAYPLLKKYNYPFSVFVNSAPVKHHSKNFMSIEQMKEMGKNGAEFGNHTDTHQYLVRYDGAVLEKEVTKEILRCEDFLENNLKPYLLKQKMLAYPFGEYDTRVQKIVQKLGYIGIAQNSSPINAQSDFTALTRFPMAGPFGSMKSFALKVNTQPMGVSATVPQDTLVQENNNPPQLVLTLSSQYKGINCFTSDGTPITIQKLSNTQLRMVSKKRLSYPRDHYTCTAPTGDGDWYWYSKMWVVLK